MSCMDLKTGRSSKICSVSVISLNKKGITVNEDALPVGYTYDKIMHKEDYDSLTPLERQAALLEYAVLDEDGEKILEQQEKTFENGKSPSDDTITHGDLKITESDRDLL